jgi:hypothetical protein
MTATGIFGNYKKRLYLTFERTEHATPEFVVVISSKKITFDF